MSPHVSRRNTLGFLASLAASTLTGCATLRRDEIGKGCLEGHVLVEWNREDKFIYRIVKDKKPLGFKPSFMNEFIVPQEMYTTGGSIPRILWGIPGLSPWGLGPAYIIHDWLFYVHRCNISAPEHERKITFRQSQLILAEVGLELINKRLIDHDLLDEIVYAVGTRYAENIWKRPGDHEECKSPPASLVPFDRSTATIVADFVIP